MTLQYDIYFQIYVFSYILLKNPHAQQDMHFAQSESVFETRVPRLADGANIKIAHSDI